MSGYWWGVGAGVVGSILFGAALRRVHRSAVVSEAEQLTKHVAGGDS